MIKCHLSIGNPWGDRFRLLGSIGKKISKNKAWELEHFYDGTCIFEIECSYTTRQDHAGIRLSFCLLGYTIGAKLYDVRHWNYLTKQYEKETI